MNARHILATAAMLACTAAAWAQTEVTSRILNPGFDGRGFGGWRNKGLQTQTNSNFAGKQHKAYAERWVAKGSDVPDSYLMQTISGLPNGGYRLTAAAQNIDQNATEKAQEGAFLTANGQTTAVGEAATYSVDFAVVDGTAEIGFCTNGCTGNWVACDNFRLYRLSTDVAYMRQGLGALMDKANELTGKSMQSSALSDLNLAMAEAQRQVANGTETNVEAAYVSLKQAIRQAENSIFFTRTSTGGSAPKVTTDPRYAVGRNIAFGRSTVSGGNILEQGFCFSSTNKMPTVADERSSRYLDHVGYIHVLDNLTPGTTYYIRAYAVNTNFRVGYGDVLRIHTLPAGSFGYNFNATGDAEIDARIQGSMDALIGYWNQTTSLTGFRPTANYNAGVQTADCSYGGWIRFGPKEDYQSTGTAMHEALHGIGVGTHSSWTAHESSGSYGTWYGKRAARLARFWDNDEGEYITGGGTHNWATNGNSMTSFTVNGAHEDAHSDLQYYGCGLLAQAMCEDGMVPANGGFLPGYCLQHKDDTKYYIRNTGEHYGLQSPAYLTASGTALRWTKYASEADVANDDMAAWYIDFDPATQYYYFRNAGTGRYLSFGSSAFNAAGTGKNAYTQIHLHLGWWDASFASGSEAINMDTYYLMHPASTATPTCLTASASGNVATTAYSPAENLTTARWMILTREQAEAVSALARDTEVKPNPQDPAATAYGYDITGAMAPYLSTASLSEWKNTGFTVNTNAGQEDTNEDARTTWPFFERWQNATALPNSSVEQTISELPNGTYLIGGSFIASWQPDANVSVQGVTFYAADQSVSVATANHVPQRYSLRVTVTDGTLTYGFRTKDTNANWVAMDNLFLIYEGTMQEYLSKASADTPVRIPLMNPRMEDGKDNNFPGWALTSEGNGLWASNTTAYNLFTANFMESWTSSTQALGDKAALQVLSLPAGKFTLQAAVNATRQNNAGLNVTGVTLCLADQATPCHTANGKPELYRTTATLAAGEHELGLKISHTDANWIAWDNVVLYYYGPSLVGDVNGDGSVSIADVTALVNIILGKDHEEPYLYDHMAADVNRDGSISIADVTALVNIILAKD